MLHRLQCEKGVAMAEYALLFSFFAVATRELMPGGVLYRTLAGDLDFRLWIVSLPIL